MNILLVNDFLQEVGGAERYFYDLKDLLIANGNEVEILGGRREDFRSFFGRFFSISFFKKTIKIILLKKVDVVHVHNCSRVVSPSVIVASKLLKVPVVMTLHDFHLYCPNTWAINSNNEICLKGYSFKCFHTCALAGDKKFLFFLKWIKVGLHRKIIKKYVDCFISPSTALKVFLERSLNLNKKIILLPYFMDSSKVKKQHNGKLEFKTNYFLFVGRLSKEKGADIAIMAIDIIKNKFNISDIRLLIIGDGPEKENLKNLTKEKKLEKNIFFLGKIDNKLIDDYYQKSTCVLIPSLWMENNPLVAYEAMRNSKPIIASNIGGLGDLIDDKKNGFLFVPGNKEELAKLMKSLYLDAGLSERMGSYGNKKLKKDYAENGHYSKLLKIYKNLLKK